MMFTDLEKVYDKVIAKVYGRFREEAANWSSHT